MPTLNEIRAAIVAKIQTVPGVGKVHGYERFTKSEKDFRLLYESSETICGWNVRRVSKKTTGQAMVRRHVTNTWQIKGFMALDDAAQSEVTFDNLVEAIGEVFALDETLGGLIDDTVLDNPDVAGIQVDDSGPVMFAGVLCHSARLTLYTRHSK